LLLQVNSNAFIYQLNRGASKSDQLTITNGLTEQANIEVYAVDGTVTATGDMTCKQQVEEKKDAGNWVKLAKSEVALAPGASTNVDFAVTVPDKADVGEHNACLVIQRKADPAAAKKGGIQLQTRQAVRMAVTIPGNIHRDVTIDKFAVDNHSKQLYNIAIKNSGNVSADVDVKLTVKDTLGNVVYKNGGEYAAIAEEVRQFRYESNLRPFWGGKYKAEVSIAYNKNAGEWGASKNSAGLTTKKRMTKGRPCRTETPRAPPMMPPAPAPPPGSPLSYFLSAPWRLHCPPPSYCALYKKSCRREIFYRGLPSCGSIV